MSLASERRDAEEQKNIDASKAFKLPDGRTVTPASVGTTGAIYNMATLKKAAKQAAARGQTGVEVVIDGRPMTYYDESIRNNPGIPWAKGDRASGFADAAEFQAAHPDTPDWVEQYGPLIVGGIAGAGLLAGGALAGGAGAGGGLSAETLASIPTYEGALASEFAPLAGGAGSAGGGGSLVSNALTGGAPGAGGGLSTLQGITAGGVTPWGAATSGLGVGAAGSAVGPIAQALGDGGGSGIGTTFGIPNNVLGGIAQGIGGIAAGNAVGDAYSDVANQYLALGAPSRARFEGSFAPGFDLTKADPGLQGSLDTAANTSARALSTRFGNPADSPTAQAEMNKYLMGNVYLPQLNTYRSQNLTGGGLGVNVAGTGSMGEAGASGMGWEALGAGLGTALNPQPDYSQLFKQFGLGGNQGGFNLNIGGLPFGRS